MDCTDLLDDQVELNLKNPNEFRAISVNTLFRKEFAD